MDADEVCRVLTLSPGNQRALLHRARLRRELGNELGPDAWVARPGLVRVGDEARVVGSDALPRAVGGWVVRAPYRVPGAPPGP